MPGPQSLVRGLKTVSRLLPASVLCFLLLIPMVSAGAEVWGYVDARGVAHFATEALDERYEIYARDDAVFDSSTLGVPETVPAATPGVASKVLIFFDILPAYKAVKHHVRAAAAAHQIDPELLQALIATESGFDAAAVSPKGAIGLMQLMPATAVRFGLSGDKKTSLASKLTNPALNIKTGARYLRYLLNRFSGQIELALAAYNAGEGAVQRAGNQIPGFKETRNYVKTVMALYTILKPPAVAALPSRPPQRVRMSLAGDVASRANTRSFAAPMTPISSPSTETD